MTTPTHFISGLAAMTLTQPFWGTGLTPKTTRRLIITGALFSILIDLDVLWAPGFLSNHHQQFTHWPLTWILVSLVTFILGYLSRKSLLIRLAPVFLLIALLHLTLDMFGITIGIPLLAPLTRQEFNFIPLHSPFNLNSDRLSFVLANPWIIGRELIVWLISLMIILKFKP